MIAIPYRLPAATRRAMTVGGLCAVALFSGCANVAMPSTQPTFENVSAAKKSLSAPVAVGSFALAKGLDPDVDRSVSVRGSNTLHAAAGETFSQHLRNVLMTELRAAGKLDEHASTTISAELMKSELSAGLDEGSGTLAAHFVASSSKGICFDKEITATDKWPSSFLAAVAVPEAFRHYEALYPQLAGKLLNDADFLQHCEHP